MTAKNPNAMTRAESNRLRRQPFESFYLPEPMSGCWLWERNCNRRGYGVYKRADGKTVTAHRHSWELCRGSIPTGLWVLHRCDNPACVNPDHLFLGDRQANVDDMMRKGRNFITRGERNGRAVLSAEQALAIRADTRRRDTVAAEYGVSNITVWEIRTNRTWKHLT